jgi:hypothetical protein
MRGCRRYGELLWTSGTSAAGKATVRAPARDFGGAIMSEPFVSTY